MLTVITASASFDSTDIFDNSPYMHNEHAEVTKTPISSQKRNVKSNFDVAIEDNFNKDNSLLFEGETYTDELSMASTYTTTITIMKSLESVIRVDIKALFLLDLFFQNRLTLENNFDR